MKKNTMRLGIANLLLVIFMAAFASFTLIFISNKFLFLDVLSKSLSDVIISSYAAESQANDLIYQAVHGQQFDLPITTTYGPTTITISGTQTDDVNDLTIHTSQPNAESTLHVQSVVVNEQTGGSYDEIDLILGLDCTSSMGACSDSTDSSQTTCTVAGKTTRIQEMKTALLTLVDSLKNEEHINLGFTNFIGQTRWMQTGYDATGKPVGRQLKPVKISDNYLVFRGSINNGFASTWAQSKACADAVFSAPGANTGTNIGAGYAFAHDYYEDTPPLLPNTKRIELIITDGLPRHPTPTHTYSDPLCPAQTPQTCSTYPISNAQEADQRNVMGRDYLACTLAKESVPLPEICQSGIRDDSVDAHAIIVQKANVADPHYQKSLEIFDAYADSYLFIDDAQQLKDELLKLITKITKKKTTITFTPIVN